MSEESKNKLEIYMHYYITQLGLKYSFHSPKLNLLGWGKPDIKLNTGIVLLMERYLYNAY